VNGNAASTGGTGVYTAKLTSIPVGITKYAVLAIASDTSHDSIQVTRQLSTPTITATSGQPGQTDFTDSVTVQFNSVDLSTDSIHYTTAGAASKILSSDPYVASGSTKKIKGTTTFRAISYRRNSLGIAYSDTATVTFVLGKTLGKPYFSTNRNDSFTVVSKVGIGGFGKDDTVRYTTDGGDPTRDNSKIYSSTDSILVQSGETIIAKSFSGGNSSPTCTTTVKLNAQTPVFSAKSGTYTSQIHLSIKSPSGVPVYYTTDGSVPTNASLKAGDTLTIDSNVTVKAMAILPGWVSSRLDSAVYRFKVATPVLSFKTGNYDTTQILSITDSAIGAKIHYTTNGSSVSCGSALYNADSALRLDSNVVVKAIACKDGWTTSDTATGNYTFKVAKITFAPDSGIYRDYQTVKLSTRSPGVIFYVTRDSSAPSWNGSGDPTGTTQKINPGDTLSVRKSQWIRVVASRNGWASSTPDSRRYLVEGDTLLVDDFEQNSLTNPIGVDWRFWGCGTCVSTGIAQQMSTVTDTTQTDWNHQIGFRNGHIDFHIPSTAAVRGADGRKQGPGYAGYSVGVPSSLMGETYRIVFWARWKPAASNPSVTSVPMVTEMVWNNNDKQNGGYADGFQRYVDTIGTSWRRIILDYGSFFPAGNAYDYVLTTDSTNTTPKSYWLFGFPDSARMVNMGLSKFQGFVPHDLTWTPHWQWGADHDHWDKANITNFRWSILQPNSDKVRLAALGAHETIVGSMKDTLVDSTYKASSGNDTTVQVTHQTPVYRYCGDCHNPFEPSFSDSLMAGFSNLDGSLELDRVQLVRRPQVAGGTTVVATKTDTTTTK
jgi:hypothetical protein